MSTRRTILITGATGRQGSAVITHLLSSLPSSSESPVSLIGVTRDLHTARAQRLSSLAPDILTLTTGDLSNPSAIFTSAAQAAGGPISALFLVQTNTPAEEAQGKALVSAAVANGVNHIVYSSGDRGGPVQSDANPTRVANFAAKFAVERHLLGAVARNGACTYTILRPVTFFENLTNDLHGKGFARMWDQMGKKKLQFVATGDIGWFAAQSLLEPEDAKWRNRALTLVGDELSQREADRVFRDVVGREMPIAMCVVGTAVKMVLRETVGDMFRWFEEEGYGGDVEVCRGAYPAMLDFRAWVEENRGLWVKEK